MRKAGMRSTVFGKLRAKFIALNMACVAVVVTLAFSAICVFDYQQGTAEVQHAITSSIDAAQGQHHDGKPNDADPGAPASNDTAPAPQASPASPDSSRDAGDNAAASTADETNQASDNADAGAAAPKIGGGQGQTIPVAVYSLNPAGDAIETSPAGTADIDDELLEAALSRIADTDDGTGAFDDLGLLYEKRTTAETTYVAFADADSAGGWKSLAFTLAGAGIAVIAVFFVITLFFSRWALRPVEQAWRSQRQFIADASHELKTPLTVILADADITLEHPEKSIESQRQWVEGIQAEGQRMQGLVEDMLALAKHDAAEAGANAAIGKQRETLDVADLAQRAVLQFEAVAFERGVEIDARTSGAAPINGVRGDIERVLGVLVDNACKYAGAGGHVLVSVKREGKHVVLSVNNTGMPIPAADLPHVFDRFWRADEARTSGAGGYGLGLSIARSIVEEHSGTLSVASSAQAGTTFTAKLPLKK